MQFLQLPIMKIWQAFCKHEEFSFETNGRNTERKNYENFLIFTQADIKNPEICSQAINCVMSNIIP